jgi:hypothetical protein
MTDRHSSGIILARLEGRDGLESDCLAESVKSIGFLNMAVDVEDIPASYASVSSCEPASMVAGIIRVQGSASNYSVGLICQPYK